MRIALLAIPLVLTACGGPETSQAKRGQADVSNTASPPAAASTALLKADFSPVSGEQAKSIMHERHEGMETIGKSNKAIKRELEGGSPDLGVVRASAARISDPVDQGFRLVSRGHRPGHRQDRRQAGDLAETSDDFPAKLARFPEGRASLSMRAAAGNDVNAIKAQLRRPRPGLQGLPRQISFGDAPLSSGRRAAGLGSADPARPLAARRIDRCSAGGRSTTTTPTGTSGRDARS